MSAVLGNSAGLFSAALLIRIGLKQELKSALRRSPPFRGCSRVSPAPPAMHHPVNARLPNGISPAALARKWTESPGQPAVRRSSDDAAPHLDPILEPHLELLHLLHLHLINPALGFYARAETRLLAQEEKRRRF